VSKRRTSGDQPAKQDQRRSRQTKQEPAAKPLDEERTSGETAGQSKNQRRSRRTKQEPAAKPPDEARTSGEAARRAKNQRFRETSARKDEPVTSRDTQGASARRRSQTLGVRGVQAEECGGIRGRPRAAGWTYEKVAFSCVKGGGALRILQSKRFEHPYEGNCTARHRARTHRGTSNAQRALRIFADLRRIHTG
jgi:hypothetical protein